MSAKWRQNALYTCTQTDSGECVCVCQCVRAKERKKINRGRQSAAVSEYNVMTDTR